MSWLVLSTQVTGNIKIRFDILTKFLFIFRGELKIVLANNGWEDFEYKKFDRIAQLVVHQHIILLPKETTEELSETTRGENGFGSSGV